MTRFGPWTPRLKQIPEDRQLSGPNSVTVQTGFVNVIAELWARASTAGAPLEPAVAMIIAGIALAALLLAWPLVRTLATICHEGGHALVAVLTGRRLRGIRVHSDTSGLTVTRGRPTGLGMVATLLAGYPAPSLIRLGAAWLVSTGHSAGLLWLLVAGLAVMLLAMRNFYGALAVLLIGTALALASWYATGQVSSWLAALVAWTLLLAGPRPVIELFPNRSPTSDAAQLARLTHLPRLFWAFGWLALTLTALAVGGRWLLAL